MTRAMKDAILSMSEYNRFSKGIFGWVGFKTYWLPYENVERVAGKTKWSFWKLFKYAIDVIINFSQAPLSIASWFGMLMPARRSCGMAPIRSARCPNATGSRPRGWRTTWPV
jgi:hypothetical protein